VDECDQRGRSRISCKPNDAPHRPRGNERSLCRRMLALFLNDSLVLVMGSNPEPNQSPGNFDRKRSVTETNSHGAVSAHLLEVL
jgi:hypothetical protein